MTDPAAPVGLPGPRNCTFCGHPDTEHAYSDEHSKDDWMNDDGSINYATHCHHPVLTDLTCLCPDMDGRGRPRAEGYAKRGHD